MTKKRIIPLSVVLAIVSLASVAVTTIGGILAIGWRSRAMLADIDKRIDAVTKAVEIHITWDVEWSKNMEVRIARDEGQIFQCCPAGKYGGLP